MPFFILLLIVLSFGDALAQGDPYRQLEPRYHISSASSYAELLIAMRQAYADVKSNPRDPVAQMALSRIYGYVNPSKRIEFLYDSLLQQPDSGAKLAALAFMSKELAAGSSVDAVLNKKIADKIWNDLGNPQFSSNGSRILVRAGITVLLCLNDDRGLDAILTDKQYVRNLQVIDHWSADSDYATFHQLSKKYAALVNQEPSAKEESAIYELCNRRKAAGVLVIKSQASVVDLDALQ